MEFEFDHYGKFTDVDMCLCNPDGRELYMLTARDRKITLKFNNISELEFTVDPYLAKSDGTKIDAPYYDYIETKRLVHISNGIGWFQISSVTENDDGIVKSKSVKAESIDSSFKNIGFVTQDKVYKFYDVIDPQDILYVHDDPKSIPSVVGQLYRQLNIQLDLGGANAPYKEWTITSIDSSLLYNVENPICRSFSDNSAYAYDFLAGELEEAFKIITEFDIENKTIQFKSIEQVTERADICISFDNIMNDISVTEDANNITTVLNCESDGIDITGVNPIGTNFIVNFDYYMDSSTHRWMSDDLILHLNSWKQLYASKQGIYESLVSSLYEQTKNITQLDSLIKEQKVFTTDLNTAVSKYAEVKSSKDTMFDLTGIIVAENVPIYEPWVEDMADVAIDSVRKNLWCYSVLHNDVGDSGSLYTQPVPILTYEQTGDEIISCIDEYLSADNETDVRIDTPGWDDTITGFGENKPFLWHKKTIVCSNGTIQTLPEIVAVYHEESVYEKTDGTFVPTPGLTSISSITYYYSTSEKDSGIYAYLRNTIDPSSSFSDSPLTNDTVITGYAKKPTYIPSTGKFVFSETGSTKKVKELFAEVANDLTWNKDNNEPTTAHLYFADPGDDGYTYCKLTGVAKKVPDTSAEEGYIFEYVCSGYEKYATYDNASSWWSLNEEYATDMESLYMFAHGNVEAINSYMREISYLLDLKNYLIKQTNGEELYRELRCYWVEGTYSNKNIKDVDGMEYSSKLSILNRQVGVNNKNIDVTKPTDSLSLSRQLLKMAEKELIKVSQPSYSFTVDSRSALKCRDLQEFIKRLKLGNVVAIEKQEQLWFYPVLLEISFSLDDDDFSMAFANKNRLQDFDYLFSDLISTTSSTSRQVSSNWSDLTSYSNDKVVIKAAVDSPINSALRAAVSTLSDVTNQDFQIDKSGILGRKKLTEEGFDPEQLRLINNIIAFTDDSWETVKTALGKITYSDDGQEKTAYGLVAEAIIGSLLIGNTLKIENSNSSIIIDKDGIRISKIDEGGDDEARQTVFNASTNGDLFVKGRADVEGNINGDSIVTDIIDSHTAQTGLRLDSDVSGEHQITATLTYANPNMTPTFYVTLNGAIGADKTFRIRYMDGYGSAHSADVVVHRGDTTGSFAEPTFRISTIYGAVFTNSGSTTMTFDNPGQGQTQTNFVAKVTHATTYTIAVSTFSGPSLQNLYKDITFYVAYTTDVEPYVHITSITGVKGGSVFTTSLAEDHTITGAWFYLSPDGSYDISGTSTECTFTQTEKTTPGTGISCMGSFAPAASPDESSDFAGYELGTNSLLWRTVHLASSPEISSARCFKTDIEDLDSGSRNTLFENLRPRAYKLKDGTSNRIHYGFVLDELGDAMRMAGMDQSDCAAYCLDDPNTPDGSGGIRYEEIIALNTLQIQKLQARIDELERKQNKEDA